MASLPPVFRQKYFTASGDPLVGGKVYSYLAGTTTPFPTYTDNSESVQNANPTILDANGECSLWLGSRGYKIVVTDSADVVQFTVDNVRSAQSGAFETIQPMTAKGDIITHTGVESTRFPVGAANTVLTADSVETTGLAWRLPHPLTAKGDIYTRGVANAARLPVGTNDQVLLADSAEATGLKWGSVPVASVSGTLPVNKGGTGQTTTTAAFDALSPATTKGDLIVHNGTNEVRLGVGSNGQALVADSAEATGLKWQTVNSGGVENFITNPGAENDLAGWSLNNITPAPQPLGSAALLGTPAGLTLTRNTTNPLNGVAEFQLAKDGSNRQGQMLLTNFNVPQKSRAKVLSIRFQYRVLSGTFVIDPSKDIASLGIYIRQFNGTTYTWTEPSSWRVLSNSTTLSDEFRAEFQTNADTISCDLAFYVGAFATGAWTIEIDDVQVSPSQYVYGTPITDWVSYTPTITHTAGGATNYTSNAYWRRVGDSIEIAGVIGFTNTSAAFDNIIVSIPSGRAIDTAKVNSFTVGTAVYFDAGSTWFPLYPVYLTTTTFQIYGINTSTTYGNAYAIEENVPVVIAAGDGINYKVSFPIVGWSSSVQMSDSTDTRVVSFVGTGAGGAVTANVTNIPTTAVRDSHGAWSGSVYTVPVAGDYQISGYIEGATASSLFWYKNGVQQNYINSIYSGALGAAFSYTLHNLVVGDQISLRSNGTQTLVVFRLAISRISGPSAIAAVEEISMQARTAQNRTYDTSANAIVYEVVDFDTHSAYNSSTGVYTCPAAGLYEISASAILSAAAFTLNHIAVNQVKKNGTVAAYAGQNVAETTASVRRGFAGTTRVRCISGDQLIIGGYSDTTTTTNGDGSGNYFSISRIGL